MFDTKTEPPLFLFTVSDPTKAEPVRDAVANETVHAVLTARGVSFKPIKQVGPEDENGLREFNYAFIVPAEGNLDLVRNIICDPAVDVNAAVEFDCFRVIWGLIFDDEGNLETRVPTGQNLVNVTGENIPAGQGYLDDFTLGQTFVAK